MRPIEIAKGEYDAESVRTFADDLEYYASNAFLWSGDDCFVMARAVTKRDIAFATDYRFTFKNPNCWFVYLAAGSVPMKRYLELAPLKLEYVAWHRSKKDEPVLKVWSWDQFEEKVKDNGQYKN